MIGCSSLHGRSRDDWRVKKEASPKDYSLAQKKRHIVAFFLSAQQNPERIFCGQRRLGHHAAAIFARARIDFDFVADVTKQRHWQLKTRVDFGWFHDLA